MKVVEVVINSGRTLLINPEQIVYLCSDPINPANCHIYLSNQDFYSIKISLEDLLKKVSK